MALTVPFSRLPATGTEIPRPVLGVRLGVEDLVEIACLVDTGAVHNRFGRWVAETAGVDLGDSQPSTLGLGGVIVVGHTVSVDLHVGPYAWTAPVTFCDPWPFGFGVLGQEGFFRYFTVTMRAAAFEMAIEPDLGPGLP